MIQELDKTSSNKPIRNEKGQIIQGTANPRGRPSETPEQKAIKKAMKELISDYKEKLAEALPQISPVLIAKALSGEMGAIKEIHNRVMGKAPQPIELDNIGELPFLIKIIQDNGTTTSTDSQAIPSTV